MKKKTDYAYHTPCDCASSVLYSCLTPSVDKVDTEEVQDEAANNKIGKCPVNPTRQQPQSVTPQVACRPHIPLGRNRREIALIRRSRLYPQ